MSKISFNDIQPNNDGRSVRDIQLPNSPIKERREKRANRRMPSNADPQQKYPKSTKRGSFLIWASALVILAALVVVATFVFIGKTNVNLTLRTAHITASANVIHSAYKTPQDGELGYTFITKTAEASKTVPATSNEFVEKKASGKLTVYNDYSNSSQRIIKNTRFESPDGKIYRVRNSFVVPGKSSIVVTVYADKPGEEYNKNSAKFTIPGLKGDPRYDKFWAEIATPITSGFSGNRAVVGESDLKSTREELRKQLREQIKNEVSSTVGDQQNVFDDGSYFFNYTSSETPDTDGKNVVVTESVTTDIIAFDASSLADEIAKESDTVLHEGDKHLVDPSKLTFSIIQKEKVDPKQDEIVQFTLSGDAKLIWSVDINSLKNDLVGKPNTSLDTTLANYSGIKDAYVTIRPFWRNNFPTNTADINVVVETNQ